MILVLVSFVQIAAVHSNTYLDLEPSPCLGKVDDDEVLEGSILRAMTPILQAGRKNLAVTRTAQRGPSTHLDDLMMVATLAARYVAAVSFSTSSLDSSCSASLEASSGGGFGSRGPVSDGASAHLPVLQYSL
jgi:hypothetical protein